MVLKKLNYFTKHRAHLGYDRLRQDKLPSGSGAIESAIRRVVNLGLKSAATFWKEATAEAMLVLRAWFKAGRWDTLEKIALAPIPGCIAEGHKMRMRPRGLSYARIGRNWMHYALNCGEDLIERLILPDFEDSEPVTAANDRSRWMDHLPQCFHLCLPNSHQALS